MRRAEIFVQDQLAGILEEHDSGYRFSCLSCYLAEPSAMATSLSRPLHLERKSRGGTGRLTLVGFDGAYILKPPVERYPQIPELEHWTLLMARCFGIDTAECGLIALEDGQLCFITRRMDRDGARKLHMEDMCQLTDRLTAQKYRGSMEQVGRAILRYCSNPLFDAIRLFDENKTKYRDLISERALRLAGGGV